MKRWILKTTAQRVISWLPWSYRWNELLQKYVTKGLQLRPADFEGKLDCCRTHWEHYQSFSSKAKAAPIAIELGTGWFPIVPVALYLCGAESVTTYDLAPLLRPAALRQTLAFFSEYDRHGRLPARLPGFRPERMDRLRQVLADADSATPAALLAQLNIHTRIGDARSTGLPAGSVDLVFSTVVFEHVPRDVLAGLFTEFRRVSSPHAVMSHYIGLKDQYANFDPSLSPFNFLKYSERQWRWLNNRMIPLTRLRIPEYRRLHVEAGYRIVREVNTSGTMEDLQRIRLAPEFEKYSQSDLLVLFSWLASTPG